MQRFFSQRALAITAFLAVMALGAGLFFLLRKEEVPLPPLPVVAPVPAHEVIGRSVEGREIDAYTYGSGEKHLVFVGGVHGGYEWNSVVLAYRFMDYLKENLSTIPPSLSITVIPSANPDGVYAVVKKEGRISATDVPADTGPVGTGRFNANDVDLNRNFDCKWKPESFWRNNPVSAGSAPFSEPEAKALRDFVAERNPDAFVFWHSQSDAVYASECEEGILPETLAIMHAYAHAAGYAAVPKFDAYEVTGDVEGWLASIGIPAITVELKTHETIEWEKNLAGIKALFEYYGEKKP